MTDEELEALLDDLEGVLRRDVQSALTRVSREFREAVDDADTLVAAAFSVRRIADMWRRQVGGIMNRLRDIAGTGSRTAAEDLDEIPPTPAELNRALEPYTAATRQLLNAVGDRMAADATQSLAEGVAAGETTDQLKERMDALFSPTGSELGPTRAQRIAATEATRAFNAGTLAAARELTGPARPLVKQWITRNDEKVRQAHRDANGQLQLIDDPFDVGGTPMQYPGDPTAPADLTINCRCIMRAEAAPATERTASMEPTDDLTADAAVHTGAMIALMPSDADAQRLAFEGGEAADQLHMTLFYLGEAADWSEDDRNKVRESMRHASGWASPLYANLFGVAQWNPKGDNPAWVWNVGDDPETRQPTGVRDVHQDVTYALSENQFGTDIPVQHSPWSPHVCGMYGADAPMDEMVSRTGPVTFDRLRVAFGGEYTDFPLIDTAFLDEGEDDMEPAEASEVTHDPMPTTLTWSTPGSTGLAFENQQTGDGRVFAPGALYWDGPGPWPLQYADEMMGGHEGAQLAGAISFMQMDGPRLDARGPLYLTQNAGLEAALLLSQGAPLGVSVDLDDVDIEMVDASGKQPEPYRARLLTASLLPGADGGFTLTGETRPDMAASSTGTMIESRRVSLIVSADGTVPGDLLQLYAAAGDPDTPDGVVLDSQKSGEFLIRITRGRVRGATLVTIPAYAEARIVLDDMSFFASAEITAASKGGWSNWTGYSVTSDHDKVLRHVRRSKAPVGAARVAQFLKIPVVAVQRILARAAARGEVVRLTRGLYTDSTSSARADHVMMDDHVSASATLTASATGAVDLPVADRDTQWDGDAAASRVFEWADGDAAKIARAFAYRDDEADPLTKAAYKLGYADVMDGELTIVPAGVSAAIGALNGARGGVNLPADEREAVRDRLEEVRVHVSEETGDDSSVAASAWAALKEMPPFRAEWFREPTAEELPPGGPGVNYANGRIFGWVAQAGEAHAGYAKKITIDSLGRIDTTHFLRQRFTLDDGSTVKAGAYTMNVGHHRDGAECETASCQFDDSRTVAGIVTVGMNDRGMWFSGAAAPWLSEWDRAVFQITQPSYHMKKGPGGGWQLRAVLSVPVPGHSSPLLASAVIERSQMALTAAATMAEVEEAVAAEEERQAAAELTQHDQELGLYASIDYDKLADAIVAASARQEERQAAEEAELKSLLAEAAKLDIDSTGTEGA